MLAHRYAKYKCDGMLSTPVWTYQRNSRLFMHLLFSGWFIFFCLVAGDNCANILLRFLQRQKLCCLNKFNKYMKRTEQTMKYQFILPRERIKVSEYLKLTSFLYTHFRCSITSRHSWNTITWNMTEKPWSYNLATTNVDAIYYN